MTTQSAGASLSHKPGGLPQVVSAAALTLALAVLWLLLHRYSGLDNDAQIYAFQALAKLQPALSTDLYLQNTSQDAFTVFSPLYAFAIRLWGLPTAALALTATCISAFLIAAWALARELSGRDAAWLAVAALIVIPGAFGGSAVFSFSNDYLTARLPAEALIVLSLACFFHGSKIASLVTAAAAMLLHPLMSFPGLLLLVALWLPRRAATVAAAAGTLVILAAAGVANIVPKAAEWMSVMDASWLDVVRQRSHFLFLNYWTLADWRLNARPFVGLLVTVLAIPDGRVRKLCYGAILVGVSGLAVAGIASMVAPIAILVQGQAWRWVWITDFICILLLAPTALQIWKDPTCGPLCAALLVLGWTFSEVDGLACSSGVLLLWLLRNQFGSRAARALQWAAYALGMVIAIWILANVWTTINSSSAESGREPPLLSIIRNVVGLDDLAVVIMVAVWYWLRATRSLPALLAGTAALLAASLYIAPKSFGQVSRIGSPAVFAEFSDWRAEIPSTSSVFIADKFDTGSFAWFTLNRPNYLSIDQSAGVVFSRKTALEVRRRSAVLLPLMEANWRILDIRSRNHAGASQPKLPDYHPLTAAALLSVCADPQLGFVIAKENVGFNPLRHTRAGDWKDWNLYECRRVRPPAPHA